MCWATFWVVGHDEVSGGSCLLSVLDVLGYILSCWTWGFWQSMSAVSTGCAGLHSELLDMRFLAEHVCCPNFFALFRQHFVLFFIYYFLPSIQFHWGCVCLTPWVYHIILIAIYCNLLEKNFIKGTEVLYYQHLHSVHDVMNCYQWSWVSNFLHARYIFVCSLQPGQPLWGLYGSTSYCGLHKLLWRIS